MQKINISIEVFIAAYTSDIEMSKPIATENKPKTYTSILGLVTQLSRHRNSSLRLMLSNIEICVLLLRRSNSR